jgi:hypothetical protein
MTALPGTPGALPDRNVPEGYRWWMRSALMGVASSQTELGQLFMEGLNVDGAQLVSPDLVTADMWFRLSMADPSYADSRWRAEVENRMTSAEITEARKQVAAFKPLSFAEAMARQIDLPEAAAK